MSLLTSGGYIVPTPIPTTPTRFPPTTTPPYSGPPDQFCVGKPDGLYPDPTNCHKYYQCAGGITYFGDCGTLAFNPVCSCCDHAANVPLCSKP